MRASALLLALAYFAHADTLALKDGRFFEGKPIEATDDGYVITFKHGKVTIPKSMVTSFFKAGAGGEFVPSNQKEKAKFEKGFVPWKGRWVKVPYRDRMRKKAEAVRKKRMEQMKERRLWRNRAEVWSKNKKFRFLHTLPDDVFQEFKDLFETYYAFFTKYWKFKPAGDFITDRKKGVTINIYHKREYFEQVSGAPSGVVGYYSPPDRDLHFFYDRENRSYTIDVMFHEGNHMLTHMINKDRWYPWWIGEGMAEYFGASEWDPQAKTMKLGRPQSGRLAVLHAQIKDKKWLKLETLLKAQRMGAIEYAWTWSFCHFLLHTPKYAKNFKKYFMAIGRDSRLKTVARFAQIRGIPSEEVVRSFKKYLRVKDLEALQKEWYQYITEGPLSLTRAQLNWGEAAYIMSLYGEHAKARRYYKKAIDDGSKDAYVHYGYAKLKLAQNMPGIAIKYSKKALEFDPLHARAWSLQGDAMTKKDLEDKEGMRLLELAHEMAPEDQQIWFALERVKQSLKDKREREAEE